MIREDSPLEPALEYLWSLEAVGISFEQHSHLESKAVEFFKATVRRLEPTGYSVRLPFKSSERPAINFARAAAQLNSLKGRSNSRDIHDQYKVILDDYLAKDFIEIVKNDKSHGVCGRVHYLPHHPVYKDSPTTPIRIVFNASS